MPWRDVIEGDARYSIEQVDCLDWLAQMPADSVDLCCFSPPYQQARLYLEDGQNLGIARDAEEWTAWMVEVFRACVRVCRGLVACVCEGQTKGYRYSCTPSLLEADLCRAGFNLRHPIAFHRIGIPGSGGPDWWRNDHERIVCVTRPGKLPWSDNTAMGHPPKWAPGGEISHRAADGKRVNADRDEWGMNGGSGMRRANGKRRTHGKRLGRGKSPAGEGSTKGSTAYQIQARRCTSGHKDGDTLNGDGYLPPVLANPGNVVEQLYTAEEFAQMLAEQGDVTKHKVGGGLMGHTAAHENEAPFPLTLAERFVRSFCPPDGITLDPFSGSGTTGHAALLWGRRFIGCDLRASQVELTGRRLNTVQPMLIQE